MRSARSSSPPPSALSLHDPQIAARREEVLRNAEIAMSHAKRHGGDRIEVFRPNMRSDRSDHATMENDLRQALDRNEIKVLFKPIVRLEDRTIAGFESMLRWDHPRLGRVGPEDFMSIAEESGLIVNLGFFLLEQTARELAAWQSALEVEPPIFASVNMSSHHLLRHDLLQDVKAVIARTGVLPGSLKLEMNESLVMENPEYSAQILSRLRDLGAGLSLDDFGTGYSALSYLLRFPFDTIKIDESFVRQMADNKPVILRSIIKMAHELGMETVAEGAETESEAIELYQLGCEYAQGPVFGEPMSMLQARQLVGRGARRRPDQRSGVAGFRGQHRGLDADPPQRLVVARIDGGAEQQVRIGRAIQPAIGLDFVLELPGGPARIAERQDRVLRPFASRKRAQDIDGRRQAHAVVDRQGRLRHVKIGRMQHETAGRLDRPADQHLHGDKRLREAGSGPSSGMISSCTRRSGTFTSGAGRVSTIPMAPSAEWAQR